MAVKKEYVCRAHGRFESTRPVCPEGCTTVEQRFFSPASVSTGGNTRRVDATLNQLALNFGYSDLSNRNGSVATSLSRESRGMAPPQDHPFAPTWGNVGDGLSMARANGVDTTFQGMAGPSFQAKMPMTEKLSPNVGGMFPPPRPIVVASDTKQ